MRGAVYGWMLADMGEGPGMRRAAAPKLVLAALVLSAVAAVVIWDPLAGLARSLDVPGALPDVPDVPRSLFLLLDKAKYILLAVILLLVTVRHWPSSTKESP
jgi:hypothetical protein